MIYHVIGLIGSASILTAYALSQAGRLDVHRPTYLVLNAIGAGLVLVDLSVHRNLGSTVLELAWLGISLHALWKFCRSRTSVSKESSD